MRKKERNYEVKINGIPQLNDMPKDLLDLLCAALLDGMLSDKQGYIKKDRQGSLCRLLLYLIDLFYWG